MIAMTFDDGPKGAATEMLLDELKAAGNVPATFFVTGLSFNRNPRSSKALLARMEAEGHSVGYHTMNHAILKGSMELGDPKSPTFAEQEIEALADLYRPHLPRQGGLLPFVRPPRLQIDSAAAEYLAVEYDLTTVVSSVGTHDILGVNASQVVIDQIYRMDPEKYSFITGHHDLAYESGVVDEIVSYGRSLGFRFVNIEECLAPAPPPAPDPKAKWSTCACNSALTADSREGLGESDAVCACVPDAVCSCLMLCVRV